MCSPCFQAHIRRIKVVRHTFSSRIAPNIRLRDPFVNYDCSLLSSLGILSSIVVCCVLINMKFLLRLMYGKIDCVKLVGNLNIRVSLIARRQRSMFIVDDLCSNEPHKQQLPYQLVTVCIIDVFCNEYCSIEPVFSALFTQRATIVQLYTTRKQIRKWKINNNPLKNSADPNFYIKQL